jgi:4'-phosphopantetheinyl transferase
MAADGTLLWLLDAGALAEEAFVAGADWLGASERARLARFVRAERRRQFLAGRTLLRLALGRQLGMAPAAVRLVERPGQAPALDLPDPQRVGFSISHSGPWVACAVAWEPIGLDIEQVDPERDVLALAAQAFAPEQAARLRDCPEAQRVAVFYRMWCLHEAHIKLGKHTPHDYHFDLPGLSGALSCARPLAPPPVLVPVDLRALYMSA